MKIHIVQKGDTLWKIAKKYGVNFEELKKMNSQLSNPDMIMPGMKIKVPTSGGTIKKEAPMGTKPGATINLGAKKEMPIAGHPFTKEKPKEMPIKTAPKKEVPIKEAPIKAAPIKEAPKKEAPMKVVPVPVPVPIPAKQKPVKEIPIKEAPIKEVPIKEAPIKEMPIKEAPIKEAPIKEVPKTPYTPKMPLKIIPEIDINNYYMNNMTNMVKQPELPPKPTNILPEVKVPHKENPVMPMESPMMEQPQMPQDYCVPVTPVMPGTGFCPPPPQWCPPPPCPPMSFMPYPQGQGAAMPPMQPYQPYQPGPMPGVAGAQFMHHGFNDESSSFMPPLPLTNPMHGSYMAPQSYGQMPGMDQMPMGGQMPGMGHMPMDGQMPGMSHMPMTGEMPYFDESPQDMPAVSPAATSQDFNQLGMGDQMMGQGFGQPGMGG
ncbi:SafA/ExsA family spore coat assembly protein, partial [Neobacillus niacini]